MEYYQLHNRLKEAFDTHTDIAIPELGVRITHTPFFSEGAKYYLPGSEVIPKTTSTGWTMR